MKHPSKRQSLVRALFGVNGQQKQRMGGPRGQEILDHRMDESLVAQEAV